MLSYLMGWSQKFSGLGRIYVCNLNLKSGLNLTHASQIDFK